MHTSMIKVHNTASILFVMVTLLILFVAFLPLVEFIVAPIFRASNDGSLAFYDIDELPFLLHSGHASREHLTARFCDRRFPAHKKGTARKLFP